LPAQIGFLQAGKAYFYIDSAYPISMGALIKQFKKHVISKARSKTFIHHSWFVQYHLEIVEKLSIELCQRHKEADKNLVLLLVWLHDYGKMIDFKDQHKKTLTEGRKTLSRLGFPKGTIDKAIGFAALIDKKENLEKAPIEVKIISSADAAAHLVGPFFYLWWHENPSKPFEALMKDNVRKAMKDWNRKVVLPEVHAAFQARHDLLLE